MAAIGHHTCAQNKHTNFTNAFKTNNKTKSNRRDDTKQSKVGWTWRKKTRYFLNLEKRKAEKKRVVKWKKDDGSETEDRDVILKEAENFYKFLYKSGNNNTESEAFFKNKLIRPQSSEKADTCEGKITKEECLQALKEMQNGKSPGSDDFTSEFYKAFWDEIGDDVVQSINYAYDKGELSICQKRGVITLLPKKNKPTNVLNNLRPITF